MLDRVTTTHAEHQRRIGLKSVADAMDELASAISLLDKACSRLPPDDVAMIEARAWTVHLPSISDAKSLAAEADARLCAMSDFSNRVE